MIHFDWSISIGQVVTLLTLIGVFVKIDRVFMLYVFEHELLMSDYAERKSIKLETLPSRAKRTRLLGIF